MLTLNCTQDEVDRFLEDVACGANAVCEAVDLLPVCPYGNRIWPQAFLPQAKNTTDASVEDVLKMILDGDSGDLEQLGEDDDDEGWTPTAMCTEGSSDSSGEEDLQDKSVDETTGEVEDQTTIQDTTTKQSARGKVKRKECH
ncbi:hypothetical protein MHYP_G00359940 [Metynnis hypsauchen]